MSFRQSLTCLDQEAHQQADAIALFEQAAAFYQQQLDRCPEAMRYLSQRGVHDQTLIRELRIGYAAGGTLRRHLTAQGYCFDLLRRVGLINAQGADALYQRVVFPLSHHEQIVNLYGRSIGAAFAHRFLAGSKGRPVCMGEGSTFRGNHPRRRPVRLCGVASGGLLQRDLFAGYASQRRSVPASV
jgi:hypothetical protein